MKKISALLLCFLAPLTAYAVDLSYGQVRLVDGGRQNDASYLAAIEYDLAPGWKTYWTHPGPFGIPTTIDTLNTQNIARIIPDWPEPYLVGEAAGTSIGYYGHLIVPLTIVPENPGAPVVLDLGLQFGACKDVCIPVRETPPALTLSDRPTLDSLDIANWQKRDIPAGPGQVICAFTPGQTGASLMLSIPDTQHANPDRRIHTELGNGWHIQKIEHTRRNDRVEATLTLDNAAGGGFSRGDVRVFLFDHDGGVVYQGCTAS